MAIFHCSMKIISHGKGKSAVGAAAYRSGTKITNEYDRITYDYTREGGVAFMGILLAENASKEYQDRTILRNEVEKIENAEIWRSNWSNFKGKGGEISLKNGKIKDWSWIEKYRLEIVIQIFLFL